jgi:hypothetical protein
MGSLRVLATNPWLKSYKKELGIEAPNLKVEHQARLHAVSVIWMQPLASLACWRGGQIDISHLSSQWPLM